MKLHRHFKMSPHTVTPKMHILECHCLPFIQQTGFGLGFLGEQGGELLHSTLAKVEKRFSSMRKKGHQLKAAVEAHRVLNSSELISLVPPRKRTKLNTSPVLKH